MSEQMKNLNPVAVTVGLCCIFCFSVELPSTCRLWWSSEQIKYPPPTPHWLLSSLPLFINRWVPPAWNVIIKETNKLKQSLEVSHRLSAAFLQVFVTNINVVVVSIMTLDRLHRLHADHSSEIECIHSGHFQPLLDESDKRATKAR